VQYLFNGTHLVKSHQNNTSNYGKLWQDRKLYITISLHRSTTHTDAAYCYRPSSVVCRSVSHTSEPCKTAKVIEVPFGLRTRVGPGNHVLDGVQIPNGNFEGGEGRPIVNYSDTVWLSEQKQVS